MLWLQTIKAGSGTMNLGGSLTRQNETDSVVNDANPHIANIGKMVEVCVCVSCVYVCVGCVCVHFVVAPQSMHIAQ